jgi:hypothetical protein|tara:strand:+ start:338 stop:1699 length:1362 start_codon:yes stop_codon:yes gene_type:complete
MALRLRRGTNVERSLITPADGELIYTTDTKRLYIGDGTTAGGNPVDTAGEFLGSDIDLNNYNITGTGNINTTGNINVTGSITADGNLTLGGNLTIGDASSDTVSFLAKVESHVIPDVDGARNLGSSSNKFNQVWANTVHVSQDVNATNINANIIADDSTVVINKATGAINAAGVFQGEVQATDNQVLINPATKAIDGATITATVKLVAPVFEGTVDGDMNGSIFGDDSTLLVDGVNSRVTLNNGTVNIDGDQIQTTTTELKLGEKTDAVGKTLQITNTDGSSPVELLVKGSASFGGVSKSTISSYHGSMTTPVQATDGDWIGAFNSEVWDPGTSSWIGSSLIAFRCDNNETVASDTAKGKIAFINNGGTGSTPALKTMSFDSRGYLAINNTLDYIATAALDVTGDSVVTGYSRMGNLTTVQRDALTPEAGMIIYNTTDNEFQGRTGAAWVALH